MSKQCDHAGWGQYAGEEGPCPPPAEMVSIEGGQECPVCGYHVRTITGADAMTRTFAANRETATTARETR